MSNTRMYRILSLSAFVLIFLFFPAMAEENEQSHGYLKTSFVGTWEGELDIVSGPKFFINNPKTLNYRINVDEEVTTLFIKSENDEWGKGLTGSHVRNNAQVVASLINIQEGFIEYYSVSLIRTGEDTSQAYILRTVNNYGITPENETHHFSMYSEGIVNRTHNNALKVDAAKSSGTI